MNEMDKTSGRAKTLWLESEAMPRFDALEKDLSCDVVVVGAGIAGLSVAYNVLQQGLSVVVLEDGESAAAKPDAPVRICRMLSNPWAGLYDPSRVKVTAGTQFLKENANTAAQYLDWLTPGDVQEMEQIAPGSGAVLRDGLKKLAVYRNPQGGLFTMSAVCPHLNAIVTWNDKEKTWDCPAHGSRFSPHGQVLNGPANSSLEHVEQHSTSKSRKEPL